MKIKQKRYCRLDKQCKQIYVPVHYIYIYIYIYIQLISYINLASVECI